MPTRSSYARTLLAAVLLLAGCGEETNLVGADSPGTMTFTYGGRTLSIMGQYRGPAGVYEEFAAAKRGSSQGSSYLYVLGVDVTTPGYRDELLLQVPAAVGEYTCTFESSPCLFSFSMKTGIPEGLGASPHRVPGAGTIRVTELTRERVKGTFNIRYVEASANRMIENGNFDVPILRENAR